MEQTGFSIDEICEYDRPTVLEDGKDGLSNWIKQFFISDLSVMPEKTQTAVIKRVEEETRDALWNGTSWVADYRRLRVIATKVA